MLDPLKQRFDALMDEAIAVEKSIGGDGSPHYVDHSKFLTWLVKVRGLLASTCGEDSQYLQQFIRYEKPIIVGETNRGVFTRLKAVFQSAKDDFDNGYLTSSLRALVQAEVFDSELEQAEELLKSGYTTAAAVVARIVLETAMRDLCAQANIPVGKLDKMNADLSKAGIYNKNRQKQITALAAVGNSAAHGKHAEFSSQDVDSMIRDIRGFLVEYMG